MKTFKQYEGYAQVTAILPRQSTGRVLQAVLNDGASNVLTLNARGSMVKDRWYQSFLPTLSAEQEMISFLAPIEEADPLMEQIVMEGNLQLFGAGAIYATHCGSFLCSDDYPLWSPGDYTFESVSFDIRFSRNLVAVMQITDKGQADGIARAAIRTGAPGPTISYIRGYGLRDRLGLLRITKTHEKELVTLVLDKYDVDAVFQAMAEAGSVDQPGKGIIYQLPIAKGLTNLASVFSAQRHSASIQQIVHAIDQIQGDTKWRANQLLIHDPKANEFQDRRKGTISDLVMLNVLCHRKDAEGLLYQALNSGAPGASLSNWRFTEGNSEQTSGGLRINREFGCLSFLLQEDLVETLQEQLCETISDRDLKQTCLYTHSIPTIRTYSSSALSEAEKGQ